MGKNLTFVKIKINKNEEKYTINIIRIIVCCRF